MSESRTSARVRWESKPDHGEKKSEFHSKGGQVLRGVGVQAKKSFRGKVGGSMSG